MKKSNHFSPEVRERAVRMVQEHRGEYPSLWAVIESIVPKIGCVPQTLNEWVQRDEIDTGARAGVTTVGACPKLASLHGMCRNGTFQEICLESVFQCTRQWNSSVNSEVGTTGKFRVGANTLIECSSILSDL